MTAFTEYKPGTFCWIDLATLDAKDAKKFYGGLFGWDFTDEPAGPDMVYTRISQGGKSVGALYEQNAEMREMKIPPFWMSYISVADANATTTKARELGAHVERDPFEVMEAGLMTVIQDPAGAYFSIWQPLKHIGADICNEPVSLCWNELMTTDVDKSGAFYTKLFGYTAETQNMGGMEYTMFANGEQPVGGMMALTPEMSKGIPTHWAIYLAVEDCDATVEKAKALGGQVYAEAQDMGVGRFAVLADPEGATFGVIKLANQPE